MSGQLPDYVIIGAMKCGTSTLAAQLGAQDGVFMTDPKEPNFFSDDAVHARGMEWYRGLFAPAAPGDLKGEASTHYTKLPTHPRTLDRLSQALDRPRLVYLIRNPLDRLVSHYIHEWTMRVISDDLDTALEKHPELIEYSRYGMQIAPWIARFGPQAVHVDTLEAMKSAPQDLLDRVGRFLGCEGLAWQSDLGQMNNSAERLRRMPLDRLLIDSAPATWLRRTLVPQALRDRLKAGRRMQQRPQISPENRNRLEAIFAEDRQALHALLPGRSDLDAAYPFVSR